MSRYFKIWISLALICFSTYGWSQVSFTAKANRTVVGKNQEFSVEFRINSRGKNFKAPSFENFRVLGGPNTSFSSYMDNSGIRQTASYSFVLRPVREGTYTIGSATIQVEGQTYRTKPLTITVTNESQQSSDPDDPYNKAAENVFVKVLTNKTTLYQGEPLVASYKVFFDTDIDNPELLEEPNYTGFYRENIELKRIPTRKESYNGKQYTSGVIRQLVLIPQRSGKIRPGKIEFKIPTVIPSGRRDFFGRMMGKKINLNTSEDFPTLEVKPLPLSNQPSNFSGAVGNYTLDVSLSRTDVSADESVTLKIKVSGSGNIKLVDIPEPEIPNAFEAYDPKYSENISINASGMKGSKTFEYLLIPRYNGSYKIPAINFSYFDPNEESYKSLRSEEFTINVTGGTNQANQPGGQVPAAEKENVDFINEDILFIKTDIGNLRKKGKVFYGSGLFYGLLLGIAGVLIAMLVYYFTVYNRQEDIVRSKQQKASKLARKHLSQARKELSSNRKEAFYAALSSALWGYFSDKLNIPLSKMTKEAIMDKLHQKGVDKEFIEKVTDIMNRAELARFTSVSDSNPETDFRETTLVITDIEKQL